MNQHSDFDRVLSRWFEDGPNTMPDRIVGVVAGRIGRQPQRRAWRLHRRVQVNAPYFRLAAVLATGLILAVVGWQLLPGRGGNIGGPATPSPLATPAPTAAPLPDGTLHAGDYVLRALIGDPMAFVITAPEGWQGFGGFFLGGPNASGAPNGVGISVNHDPEVVSSPCDAAPHTPAPSTSSPSIDDLVAAISSRADLQISSVSDTVLAGYAGKRVDIQFPATLACENQYLFAEPKGLYANGPGNHWRVWLLDVGGDTAVVVLLDYAATPAADRTAAEAAIASIRITP
jgi:hypothetical protein